MAKPIIYASGEGYVPPKGPQYRFHLVIHELYENSERAREFVALAHNFGNMMDERAAVILPVPAEYANIRRAILSLPWNTRLKQYLESYQHPYMILSRDVLGATTFNPDSVRFFFFTNALKDPDSYFPLFNSLATEVNKSTNYLDLYCLNPNLPQPRGATLFFQRLWKALLLQPNFGGFGVDLKILLESEDSGTAK